MGSAAIHSHREPQDRTSDNSIPASLYCLSTAKTRKQTPQQPWPGIVVSCWRLYSGSWPLDLGRRWRLRPMLVCLEDIDLPDPTFQFEIDSSRTLLAVSAWECHLTLGLFSVDLDFLDLRFPDL